MTEEKAIEILKDMIEFGWGFSDNEKSKSINACEMAIEALELQIPNEWQTEKFDSSYFLYTEPKMVYVCPNCKGITDDAYRYCPHCGKAKIKKEIKDL